MTNVNLKVEEISLLNQAIDAAKKGRVGISIAGVRGAKRHGERLVKLGLLAHTTGLLVATKAGRIAVSHSE